MHEVYIRYAFLCCSSRLNSRKSIEQKVQTLKQEVKQATSGGWLKGGGSLERAPGPLKGEDIDAVSREAAATK